MNKTEQNIALAEACGWRFQEGTEPSYGGTNIPSGWINPKTKRCVYFYPKCTEDLNACHEMESALGQCTPGTPNDKWNMYCAILVHVTQNHHADLRLLIHATAAQRSEALCRTLWPDRFKAKQKRRKGDA